MIGFNSDCHTATIASWDAAGWQTITIRARTLTGWGAFLRLHGGTITLRGFVASEQTALTASQSAIQARDAANAALAAANTARDLASAANHNAWIAATNAWDSAEGKSAATLAREARDQAALALTAINNALTTINNMQASIAPQLHRVRGLNGITATRTSSFSVVVDASGATEFRARRKGGTWTGWTSVNNSVSVSNLTAGANTIQAEVRNVGGATAIGQMLAFRL